MSRCDFYGETRNQDRKRDIKQLEFCLTEEFYSVFEEIRNVGVLSFVILCLCPKCCVVMSLRKCTSLSAGAAKPPSAPPCDVLPRLFIRQESHHISYVLFFYTL